MKFISFIASTMLIVLISQHSMGLPLTSTMLGETCPEGFEMLNGKCMPIQSSTIGVETVTNLTEVITHTLPEEDHVTKVISHTLSAEDQVTEATTHNLPEELHVTEVTTHALPEEVHVTEVTDHTLPVEDHVTEVITHTLPEEDHVTQAISPKTSKQCPAGSEYLENGECGPVEPQVIKKLNDESTTSSILPETATEHEPMVPLEEESTTEVNIPKISKRCPPGSSYLKNGKCGPVKRLAIKTLDDESTTSSILSETATEYEPMVPTEEESTTEVDIPTISERCPPGSSYLKNGKCGPLKRPIAKKSDKKSTVTVEFEPTVLSETTEMIHELTTDLNDEERTGGVDNPQGCPKGTQVDEQGACQEIQGADTEKMTTEPNFPVNQKCPAGYKKLNGRCVYTETKTSSSYLQPKIGDIETSTDEVVPVSDDSTCPDGTAYIASGFCKKLNRPTPANVPVNSEGRCRANYELVDAMCVYKGSKVSSELGVSASTIAMPLHATVDEVQIEVNTDNLFQSTATVTDE